MSEMRKYGVGQLFTFPLIADGAVDFVTDYTPAAGDAKLWSDTQISTNLTSLILGFDSLSEIPAQGAQLDENGAGTAEGVVEFTVITSGTVGGGDAAGFFFMRSVTGQAWSNDDQIDINGGTANIATADSTTYDLAATAGLIADLGNGLHAAALSPTEMTCTQGELHVIDSATKAIEDQAVRFTTYGNASALHAVDLDDSVRAGLTALPNVAAGSAGGLPDDTDSNGAVRIVDGTGARELNTNSGAVALVDLVTTTTTNTDMRGTDSAATEAKQDIIDTNVDTLVAKLVGITLLNEWLGLIAGKQAGDATALTEIKATGAGSGTYDPTTDSTEAVRDHVGDGTNLPEAGGDGDHLVAIPATVDWLNGGRLDLLLDAIKAVTDQITFTTANQVDSRVLSMVGSVIDSSVIAANAIGASEIANGAIDAATFAAGAIDAASLATDAVNEIRDSILPTQNAAFTFKFTFVAASDHVTPVTGATGTAVTRSIDGGAFGAGGGTLSEIANGVYRYAASAGDMNGGEIGFRFVGTGGTPGAPDDAFVYVTTTGGV